MVLPAIAAIVLGLRKRRHGRVKPGDPHGEENCVRGAFAKAERLFGLLDAAACRSRPQRSRRPGGGGLKTLESPTIGAWLVYLVPPIFLAATLEIPEEMLKIQARYLREH